MGILFLGGMFPKDQEAEIIRNSKGIIQIAANQLQWNLIDGIEQYLNHSIDLISSVFVGYYPTLFKKWHVKSRVFSHRARSRDYSIGFINVKGFEIYHRMFKLIKPVKKWLAAQDRDAGINIVFAYSAQAQFLHAVRKIKEYDPNAHVCLIVPDLPEYMTVTDHRTLARFVYNMLMKKGLNHIIYRNMALVDSFVLLTEPMKERLQVGGRPYVIIEGVACDYLKDSFVGHDSETEVKTVLYTGTMAEQYGVLDLVRAFMSIKGAHYKLVLCGAGDSETRIREYAAIDPRVQFKGSLAHREIILLQAQATVLVNPRKNQGEYTKYSFPSKTLEYMQSGRPVLMYRLDGIPKEYDRHLMYFSLDGSRSMAETIVDACESPRQVLAEFGARAREFVLGEKNAIIQAERIIRMIHEKIYAGQDVP
jgi:glycosyltransferase involved in cell wall biosynthesis